MPANASPGFGFGGIHFPTGSEDVVYAFLAKDLSSPITQIGIYEGAAGKRVLGEDADMTTDTVLAIFSTTKAITGTTVLQCVEEGKLDLDAPAKHQP